MERGPTFHRKPPHGDSPAGTRASGHDRCLGRGALSVTYPHMFFRSVLSAPLAGSICLMKVSDLKTSFRHCSRCCSSYWGLLCCPPPFIPVPKNTAKDLDEDVIG